MSERGFFRFFFGMVIYGREWNGFLIIYFLAFTFFSNVSMELLLNHRHYSRQFL